MPNPTCQFRSRVALTGAFLLSLTIAFATPMRLDAQRAEPVGRLLGDLGKPTAVERGQARAAEKSLIATAEEPTPVLAFTLLPSGQGSRGTTAGALQLQASNETWVPDWTFSGSAKDQVIHTAATNRNQVVVSLEVDPSLGPKLQRLALAVGGNYSKRFSEFAAEEGYAQVDGTLYENKARRWLQKITVGPAVYYDRATPDGSTEASSGWTFGTAAGIALHEGSSLAGEYDFNSDFNGEDYASVRLSQRVPVGGYSPALVVGLGKHRIVSIALKLPLNHR